MSMEICINLFSISIIYILLHIIEGKINILPILDVSFQIYNQRNLNYSEPFLSINKKILYQIIYLLWLL